jgi:hypothetical protein
MFSSPLHTEQHCLITYDEAINDHKYTLMETICISLTNNFIKLNSVMKILFTTLIEEAGQGIKDKYKQ